jgi:hypothetical protein
MVPGMNKNSYKLLTLIAAVLLIGGLSSTAEASGTGLTIQPVKASYTLTPGQSVTDNIILKNPSIDAFVTSSVQDFLPIAGSSNLEFVAKAAGVTSVVDWIKVDAPKGGFQFKAGADINIPYTLTVPKDAEPGSHFGVIFFLAQDANGAAGQSLKIGTQVGMLVLVTVPGSHLQKGTIDSFTTSGFIQHGPVHFDITFENTGTVYFEPKGTITITNMFGSTVGTVPVNGQVVLPTGKRDITADWPVNLLFGPYNAAISLYDGDGNVISANNVHFFAFPVWYIVSILILLILLYVIFVFLKRKVSFSVSLKK